MGTDQTRAGRCKLLDLDEGEGLPFLTRLACHSAAPAVIFLVSLELQDNHRALGNSLKELRVVEEVLIKLLDQKGVPFVKLFVHKLSLEKDPAVLLPIHEDVFLGKGPSLVKIHAQRSFELPPIFCIEIPVGKAVCRVIAHDRFPLILDENLQLNSKSPNTSSFHLVPHP